VVSGAGSSHLLRTAVGPNDQNSNITLAFETGVGQSAGEMHRLYEVFNSTPAINGIGYWIDVLIGFNESPENINLIKPLLVNGLYYQQWTG
jgi:hypothetical protein